MTETLSSDIPDALEEAVDRLLRAACDADLGLATAESCTGGLLASLLTDVEGCSHAFERGFVTYTEEAKSEMLGVPPAMLDEHGAVSRAGGPRDGRGGARRGRAADIAVSITGFAGPTGDGRRGGARPFRLRPARTATPPTARRIMARSGAAGCGSTRLKVALEMIEEALA